MEICGVIKYELEKMPISDALPLEAARPTSSSRL